MKHYENLQVQKLQLIETQEGLQNDYNGLQKTGKDRMRQLETMK